MGGGAFQKITLMRGGGMRKKSEIGGGVIQFSNYTPPNLTRPPYPIKNERSPNCPPRNIKSDLRPITLTSCLAKLLEGFTNKRLLGQVPDTIDPRQ